MAMPERRFIDSLNAAIEGFIYVLKTQRNMRIHFLSALLIILLAIYLNFKGLELLALCITITVVLTAEMVNTALELTVDMIKSDFHPIARIIKDVSAGAVLVTSINAAIVGYLLFSRKFPFRIDEAAQRIRQSPWHITFISLILVLGVTIIGKVIFHKGTPLRGGMPSGHAAVAFSMWSAIIFLTHNPVIVVLTFVMAFLIARQRIRESIHTVGEVIAGSVVGVLITTLVFQLFR